MFDMFGGFSATKLKPQLKMAVSRLQIASNKKAALLKQQMREVAVLLAEEPPKEEKARIRAEALIRDDNMIEAYEILQLACELLAERIKLLQHTKECPADLVSCVSTIIYATPRVDIPELALIRKQFRAKYGKQFEEDALNNVGGCLNERVVTKLSVQPPAAYLVQTYLERICEQFEVDWKPRIVLTASQMAEPMAAPVGFSVQAATGTGLGEVTTGTLNSDEEIGYQKPDLNYQGGPVATATPVVQGTNYHPGAAAAAVTHIPQAPGAGGKKDDFEEVDIFVPSSPTGPPGAPAAPTAPSAPTAPAHGGGNHDDDDDDTKPSADGGSGQFSTSYNDLAARFSQLNK